MNKHQLLLVLIRDSFLSILPHSDCPTMYEGMVDDGGSSREVNVKTKRKV